VARHVADHDADLVFGTPLDPEEIVVVAADLLATQRPTGDVQAWDRGCGLRQQAALDFPGQRERALLQGEVDHEHHVADDSVVPVPQRHAVNQNRNSAARAMNDRPLVIHQLLREKLVFVCHQVRAVIAFGEPHGAMADDVLARVAYHSTEGLIDVRDREAAVHQEEAVHRCLDDAAEFFLALAKGSFREHALELG